MKYHVPKQARTLQRVPKSSQPKQGGAAENLSPDKMLYLQRTLGNHAIQRLVNNGELSTDGEMHGKGCSCAACSRISRKPDGTIQRDGPFVKEMTSKLESDDVVKKFEPATLKDPTAMAELAKKIDIKGFISLAASHKIVFKGTITAIIKYFTPVMLADLDPLIKATDAAAHKTVWGDASLMTQAAAKLGTDEYLTFVTRLGMHHAPTTDELSEGGKEHTKAPEADKLIREKLDTFVTEAVKAKRQIEGIVAVVGTADWDRAGINHYGKEVWTKGPPPKTPKKDAINGFVDAKGRVWIERNSGNPGTLIHEGLHKYSHGAVLSNLGFNVNEGMTEYFTRIITKELKVDRGNYETNFKVIESLVKISSRETVASAYFDGSIDGLKAAFLKFRKDKKKDTDEVAATNWRTFVSNFKSGSYGPAENLIK